MKYYCGAHSGMGGSANHGEHTLFPVGRPIRKTTDRFGKTVGTGYYEDPLGFLTWSLAAPNQGAILVTFMPLLRVQDLTRSVDNSGVTKATESTANGTSGEFLWGTDSAEFYGSCSR